MNNRTKLGLNILEAALLLGVLGDALLRETPWGLNVFLWTGAVAAAMYVLHARSGGGRASWRADGGWLWLPVAFFAAAFAWRDSATLNMLAGLSLFVAFALLAWRARGRKIRLGGVADYALGLGHAAFNAMFAILPLVASDVRWTTSPRTGAARHAWAAARGLVIAVPLLLVFGGLLMAADAVFEGIMRETFQIDLGVLFSHFFLILLFAWMTGGFLRGMMLSEETASAVAESVPVAAYTSITIDDGARQAAVGATREAESNAHRQSPGSVVVEGGATEGGGVAGEKPGGSGAQPKDVEGEKSKGVEGEKSRDTGGAHARASGATVEAAAAAPAASPGGSLGAVEVGVVLGSLNVLFACFVIVQFRYFFGGAARVMSITELTFSEYARRGFFELTWVAGLMLPLLLGAHALLRKNSPAAGRIFRPLAGAQIALLFVIMASAITRMHLYQSEYGLTELRLYTTAFMLWLGLVFIWFAWTVLVHNRRERFACGALVAAFATIAFLHFFNPDAYIVRANAAHARAGRSFDAAYAVSLSADAVPALVSVTPSLGRDERCLVESALAASWTSIAVYEEDWRAWNLARWRARRAAAPYRNVLSAATCPPLPSSVPAGASTGAPAPTPPAPATNATPAGAATGNAATDGNANALTTGSTAAIPGGTKDAATGSVTKPAMTETKSMTSGASNATRSTPGRNGKTKQRPHARAARKTKTR